jgi:hypothetical protein
VLDPAQLVPAQGGCLQARQQQAGVRVVQKPVRAQSLLQLPSANTSHFPPPCSRLPTISKEDDVRLEDAAACRAGRHAEAPPRSIPQLHVAVWPPHSLRVAVGPLQQGCPALAAGAAAVVVGLFLPVGLSQ